MKSIIKFFELDKSGFYFFMAGSSVTMSFEVMRRKEWVLFGLLLLLGSALICFAHDLQKKEAGNGG